jgi:ribosomal protein S18 acetylase RimI-like enzyme
VPRIEAVDAAAYEAALTGLGELLVDAVEHGASVSMMPGLTVEEAKSWWAARAAEVADGTTTPFVAFDNDLVVGSVLLIRARQPNAPHRAEIAKVIVHSNARRRGIGRALMSAAEALAKAEGRWLLILDTVPGSEADALYRSLGWHEAGTIPNFALLPNGEPGPTTYFWKDLR